MLVVHDGSFSDLLKCAILSFLQDCEFVHENANQLLMVNPRVAHEFELDDLVVKFEALCNKHCLILHDKARLAALRRFVELATLYKSGDRFSLVIRVIEQAIGDGLSFVTSRISKEAREVFRRKMVVLSEICMVKNSTRFRRRGNVMWGEASFAHCTEQVVMKQLSCRYPDALIIICDGASTWFSNRGDVRRLFFPLRPSEFECDGELWDRLVLCRSDDPGLLGNTRLTDFFPASLARA